MNELIQRIPGFFQLRKYEEWYATTILKVSEGNHIQAEGWGETPEQSVNSLVQSLKKGGYPLQDSQASPTTSTLGGSNTHSSSIS